MSSRTWWKSSSRDFVPSRYTEIRKATVRGPGSPTAARVTGAAARRRAASAQRTGGLLVRRKLACRVSLREQTSLWGPKRERLVVRLEEGLSGFPNGPNGEELASSYSGTYPLPRHWPPSPAYTSGT